MYDKKFALKSRLFAHTEIYTASYALRVVILSSNKNGYQQSITVVMATILKALCEIHFHYAVSTLKLGCLL